MATITSAARVLWAMRSKETRKRVKTAVARAVKPDAPVEARKSTERWNKEWLVYLGREFDVQLAPHTDYVGVPPLPDDAVATTELELRRGEPLDIYAERAWIEGKRVLEVGCGCGYLGKQIGRYVDSYLGVDYSTLALKIARLVSPPNCRYVHIFDRPALEPFFGTIDTAIGRHFWIHQNMDNARDLVRFMEPLLKSGGRIVADFYWPNAEIPQSLVLTPYDALSSEYPSAAFAYAEKDVDAVIAGSKLKILRAHVHPKLQRRFVVFEKTG
jgi:SAM-dependent methyltransferase